MGRQEERDRMIKQKKEKHKEERRQNFLDSSDDQEMTERYQ